MKCGKGNGKEAVPLQGESDHHTEQVQLQKYKQFFIACICGRHIVSNKCQV